MVIGVPERAKSGRFWLEVVGFLASVATLTLFFQAILDLKGPGWADFLAAAACAFIFALLVVLYRLERAYVQNLLKQSRRVRVAAAAASIHAVHHCLRDCVWQIREGDSDVVYMQSFREAMSAIATTFTTITGADCRACVKRVEVPKTDVEFRNVVVTTLSRNGGPTGDGWDRHNGPDYVSENTDFALLFSPQNPARFFFANDLDAIQNYHNSHWTEGVPSPETGRDYNATVVWPIRKEILGDQRTLDVVAFLCVDTLAKNVFEESIDFHLGASFADALYGVVKEMKAAHATKVAPAVAESIDLNKEKTA